MHRFTCDLCDGNCELTVNVCDMEDVLPEFCHAHEMRARWFCVDENNQKIEIAHADLSSG